MAFRSEDYGYSRMKVYNHTHVTVEQISADQVGGWVELTCTEGTGWKVRST